MRYLAFLSFVWLICLSANKPNDLPDLKNKEDLHALGYGRIYEKDKSIITKIILEEVNEYGIVYSKNGSLHDFPVFQIDRIEFLNTKWGPLKIVFREDKPHIIRLN